MLPESKHDKQVSSPSKWISFIKKCKDYGISDDLMLFLNYNDLLALVIEYQIQDIKDYFKRKQAEYNAKSGYSGRKATPEDINNL